MRRPLSQIRSATFWRALLTGAFAMTGCFAATAELSLYAASPQAASAPTSAQISAAFIFNFVKFTEWPRKEFPHASSPVTVCFMAAEEVRAAFESVSAGKDLNGRPVVVRDVKSAADVSDCRVLYVLPQSNTATTGVLRNARLSSALAIGASDDFLEQGGVIRLLVENNRMRFDVNVGAANRANLHLSSKLLALARSVVDLPEPGSN